MSIGGEEALRGEQEGAGGTTKGKNIRPLRHAEEERDGPTRRYVSSWAHPGPEIRRTQANVWTAEGKV